jgi:glycine betaine catabolism B
MLRRGGGSRDEDPLWASDITAALGVPAADYHEESFVAVPAVPADTPVIPEGGTATATYTVEFARSGRSVACEPGVTLLSAADRAGVRVPSSCGQGLCGTCKVTRLSGEVEMSHQGGIRPKEIAAGRILLCCSVPKSDVVIDV